MRKFKNLIIYLGQLVAILMMIAPLYVADNYSQIENSLFWLIWFILYDIYMYSIIKKGGGFNGK